MPYFQQYVRKCMHAAGPQACVHAMKSSAILSCDCLTGAAELYNAHGLTEGDLHERLRCSPGTVATRIQCSSGASYDIRYAYVSQRGYYPDAPDKANQDNFAVTPKFCGDVNSLFAGVFDGHGTYGDLCSQFVADYLPRTFAQIAGKAGTLGVNMICASYGALESLRLAIHCYLYCSRRSCCPSSAWADFSCSRGSALGRTCRGRCRSSSHAGPRQVLVCVLPTIRFEAYVSLNCES